jgi:hypothetical protein
MLVFSGQVDTPTVIAVVPDFDREAVSRQKSSAIDRAPAYSFYLRPVLAATIRFAMIPIFAYSEQTPN